MQWDDRNIKTVNSIGVYSNTKFYFFPPSKNSLKKFPPFLSKICKILGKNCQNLHKFLEKMSKFGGKLQKFAQFWVKSIKNSTFWGQISPLPPIFSHPPLLIFVRIFTYAREGAQVKILISFLSAEIFKKRFPPFWDRNFQNC